MNCQYCYKICKNQRSLVQHEIRCPENEHRMAVGFTQLTARTKSSGRNYEKLIEYNKNKRYKDVDVFVENSSYPRHRLKERIVKNNLIPYKCACCGMSSVWNDLPLVLQLDHINGVNNDNRLENIRFLCPNCHSQQGTYAGKNKKLKNMSLV